MVNRKTIVVMRFFPSAFRTVHNCLASRFQRAGQATLPLAWTRAVRSRFAFQIVTGVAADGQLDMQAKQR
ncbi:hypothetical protein IMCC20628_01965 [Hoeflea sp. IMCC20628]|nr:hypothetical protein IMCC20628_01965 [Hoeflea sp. IMCC20628]